jgi:hypothetical protein
VMLVPGTCSRARDPRIRTVVVIAIEASPKPAR